MTDTKPVAWHFKCDGYESTTLLKKHADAMAKFYSTDAIPLYHAATLTAEEREAVETAIATLDAYRYPTLPAAAATLRNLLERLK
jgi:hypothetical protein